MINPGIDKVTTTGNSYADVKKWKTNDISGLIFLFSCTDNNLKVQILGSLDGESFDITAMSEFTLTAAATATEKRITKYYPWIKIQVKPAVAGNHGTLTTVAVGIKGKSSSAEVKLATEDLTALENITIDTLTALPTKTPATTTGTCTAAYVTALTWTSLQSVQNKTIIVANTHATLTMKYRIRGYAKSGSSYYNEIQSENTLAASTMQPHVIQNHYDVITVEVIDGSGHATYAIDYAGGQ